MRLSSRTIATAARTQRYHRQICSTDSMFRMIRVHWAQVGDRYNAPVHRTRLLREPLGDAGIAESMLTVRGLEEVKAGQRDTRELAEPGAWE